MISLLCPTRGRPENLRRMIESVRATQTREVAIDCYVDDDDPARAAYLKLMTSGELVRYDGGLRITIHWGPRQVHSDYWNKLAARVVGCGGGDLLMMVGDDCVFLTPGWDEMVEAAFARCPDQILMVHGDDGGPNGNWYATHPVISRRWYEVAGRFTGEWFPGDFADHWIQEIALALGRRQFLPFVNEHMHPLHKKAPMDRTYQETMQRRDTQNSLAIYEAHSAERLGDTAKLRAVMDPEWKP